MKINNQYDVAVAYRIYPKISKKPFFHSNDKFLLSEICIKSFKLSLGKCRAKIWVLLDGCPDKYRDLFLKYFDSNDLVFLDLDSIGNHATFDLQLDILLDQDVSEIVFFAEDDYLYRPGQFSKMIEVMNIDKVIDFITPYDHPDYYNTFFCKGNHPLLTINNVEWMKVPSTCLTFITRKNILAETEVIFRTYKKGNRDTSVWEAIVRSNIFSFEKMVRAIFSCNISYLRIIFDVLRFSFFSVFKKKKFILISPVSSIATHAESEFIAPNINWKKILDDVKNSSCNIKSF